MNEIPFWLPGQDFMIRLDDKTADPRTKEELDKMVDEIRNVANKYDFDLCSWGSGPNMDKSIVAYSLKKISENLVNELFKGE